MRVIALTGGTGVGKTTIANLYRKRGIPVVDADAISRALTAPQGEALPAIRMAFGAGVFDEDDTLNRAALSALVFGEDADALSKLNAIMHPRITAQMLQRIAHFAKTGHAAVLLDIPLLFETGMDAMADAVICITAPETLRIRRICERDGISQEQAKSRMQSQNSPERTENLSDYVLSTDAPFWVTRLRTRLLWRRVMADGPKRAIALPAADNSL